LALIGAITLIDNSVFRLQFVARHLAGQPMAELCREFGISRETGYKIFARSHDRSAVRQISLPIGFPHMVRLEILYAEHYVRPFPRL